MNRFEPLVGRPVLRPKRGGHSDRPSSTDRPIGLGNKLSEVPEHRHGQAVLRGSWRCGVRGTRGVNPRLCSAVFVFHIMMPKVR